MKYVIFRRTDGVEFPVIFGGFISHADVAALFSQDRHVAMSAGFVRFLGHGTVDTHDQSLSLNLSPRPGDAMLIGAYCRATLQSIGVPVMPAGRWSVLDSSPAEGARPLPPEQPAVPSVPGCVYCPDCPVRPA